MIKRNKDQELSFNPFDLLKPKTKNCFLCGKALSKYSSVEHVFPKWLQNRFNLWDKQLTLSNKSEILYRNLKIPCCNKCNNDYLAKLENEIAIKVGKGFIEFKGLDELKIFQWLGKIEFGILFEELTLLYDRKRPEDGTIISPKMLEYFRDIHGFLQSLRLPFEFCSRKPWSIFIFNVHSYNDERDFDYTDTFYTQNVFIRMSDIAVAACLFDNNTQKEMFKDYFQQFEGIKLHPIQFDEICAKISYKSTLLNRDPSYVAILPDDEYTKTHVINLPTAGFNPEVFDDWNPREYAKYLEYFWAKYGIRFEDIYKETGEVATYLFNEDDSINIIDKDCKKLDE